MDKYKEHNHNYLIMEHNNRYVRDQKNPSFSSTLLDQIYRSIDETNDHKGTVKTVKKKKQFIHTPVVEAQGEADFQRIENWMEKTKGSTSEKITKSTSGKSAASTTDHMYTTKTGEKYGSFVNLNSSWSSSDSSSGALFSSEAESNYGVSSRSSSTTTRRPKPIKITNTDDIEKFSRDEGRDHESVGVVKRSKLKALKIYGELKKAKQPISPGAKLASFLNSLFTTGGGNVKKGKISSGADSLTASPACSTSRSCLSKSPGKLSNNNGTKRSVRFYPVSVIVDEDCHPCGHKSLQHGHGIKNRAVSDNNKICKNEEPRYHMIRRKDQSVEEAARELLRNYQRKVESQMELQEDEDDDASCTSSDLFELDNLNNDNYDGIDDVLGNYMEELPVYETTNYLDTNRAIIAINSLVV